MSARTGRRPDRFATYGRPREAFRWRRGGCLISETIDLGGLLVSTPSFGTFVPASCARKRLTLTPSVTRRFGPLRREERNIPKDEPPAVRKTPGRVAICISPSDRDDLAEILVTPGDAASKEAVVTTKLEPLMSPVESRKIFLAAAWEFAASTLSHTRQVWTFCNQIFK